MSNGTRLAYIWQKAQKAHDDALEARNDAKKVLDKLMPQEDVELRLAINVYAEAQAKWILERNQFKRLFPKGTP